MCKSSIGVVTGYLVLALAGCGGSSGSHGFHGKDAIGSSDSTTTGVSPSKNGGVTEKPDEKNATGLTLVRGDGELGNADYGEKRSTTFTIKNNSPSNATLELIDKSCACAGVAIKPQEVPAGGTTEVTLTWVPKIDQIEVLGQNRIVVSATLQARERPSQQIRLEAVGRIAPALHVHLPRGRLDFDRIELGQLKAGKRELAAVIYTTDPKRKGFRLEAHSSSPGLKLVPPAPERLAAADLQPLNAVDGYRVNIRAAEGLPIGSFNEIIRLKSDVYENRELEIAVEGYVDTGAVSLRPLEKVQLPEKISLKTGYKSPPLTLTLQFEANREITLEKVEPAFLQVTTKRVQDNTWQIDVQIPAGEAAILKHATPEQLQEYCVYEVPPGAITFKTTHSLVPVLKIPVDGTRFQK